MLNRTLVRRVLSESAEQLEPHLSNLERAVERPLDAVSFSLGLLTAALIMGRADIVRAAEAMRPEFDEFIAKVAERHGRDLGPYRRGVLASGFYQQGLKFDPGTVIRWRTVDDRFVEVMFPPFDGFVVRWLERALITSTEPS